MIQQLVTRMNLRVFKHFTENVQWMLNNDQVKYQYQSVDIKKQKMEQILKQRQIFSLYFIFLVLFCFLKLINNEQRETNNIIIKI